MLICAPEDAEQPVPLGGRFVNFLDRLPLGRYGGCEAVQFVMCVVPVIVPSATPTIAHNVRRYNLDKMSYIDKRIR